MRNLFLIFILFLSFNAYAQDQETDQQERLKFFTILCLQGMLKETCNKEREKCEDQITYEYADTTILYVRKCREAMSRKEIQENLSNEIAKIIPKYLNVVDIKND